MKYVMSLLFVLATPLMHGQTAKVIQLSPEDARQAKALDDAQNELTAKIAAFRETIKQKYLVTTDKKEAGDCYAGQFMVSYVTDGSLVLGDDGTISSATKPAEKPQTPPKPAPYYRLGWRCGEYQYSDDFKFIVPVPASPYTSSPLCTTFTN